MYTIVFESSEEVEHFRHYLKKHTEIDLPPAYERSDDSNTHYEFESYGYPGFVMTMVHRICFNDTIDYERMGRLPPAKREKYLADQLFSHALLDVKTWRPPGVHSRELRWVAKNLKLTDASIRKVSQRAEKKYYRWLKMESHYSVLMGMAFLLIGILVGCSMGMTQLPTILLFLCAIIFLLFGTAKFFQHKKKRRTKLPG